MSDMYPHLQELQVMKVKQSEGTKCYVASLNSTSNALPEAVLNSTATVRDYDDDDDDGDDSNISNINAAGTFVQ